MESSKQLFMSGYVRSLQITSSGIDRYEQLQYIYPDIGEPEFKELTALGMIIRLHPLDYIFRRGAPKIGKEDFVNLVRKGYVVKVQDHYSYMVDTLEKYDPELLPVFTTYAKLAYEKKPSEMELDQSLNIMKSRIQEEKGKMAMTKHLDELLEKIGEPKTKRDKAIALDTAISTLHWDPDLLRKLPKRNQPLVGDSIAKWLDQLAGRK